MNPRFLVYLILLLVTLIYSVVNLKKLSRPFRILSLLIFFTLVSESMTWSGIYPIENPLILYHILLPLTMLLLWFISRYLFKENRKIIIVITALFILLNISNSIWNQQDVFPSHGLSLLCNLAVFLSLLIFKNIIFLPAKIKIVRRADFWFAISTLSFYSITFFTFTFYNLFIEATWLQDVKYYSGLIFYVGYLIAFYFDVNRFKYNYEND